MRLSNFIFISVALFISVNAADLNPFKWLLSQASYGSPIQLLTSTFPKRLNDPCRRSVDCIELSNSVCINEKCQCQIGYFMALEDPSKKNPVTVCKQGCLLTRKFYRTWWELLYWDLYNFNYGFFQLWISCRNARMWPKEISNAENLSSVMKKDSVIAMKDSCTATSLWNAS